MGGNILIVRITKMKKAVKTFNIKSVYLFQYLQLKQRLVNAEMCYTPMIGVYFRVRFQALQHKSASL